MVAIFISREKLGQQAEPDIWVVEASELGLPPGGWPTELVVEAMTMEGLDVTFSRQAHKLVEQRGVDNTNRLGCHLDIWGDIICQDYKATDGPWILRVWND